jgi:phage/plasmid-associated DNA primase
MNANQQLLKPGEIRLDYIPIDWPLTPLGGNKDPYVAGWQNKPFSVREIEEELTTEDCKAIGLLGGPVYNHPYGLVWVDVDGPSVYKLLEDISGLPLQDALPPTLTIFSGKIGRERKLYRLDREKHKHFARNKYTWHAEGDKEKLEILWKKHQGVLMGLHPETNGYFTGEGCGFEWSQELPEFPEWLLAAIINKNVKQGIPSTEISRVVMPSSVVHSVISVDRDMKLAVKAMWALPPEAADDYDIWIMIGQSLHSLDESLLDDWDNWSQQSDKYREGECHKRWLSFSKGGGRGIGTLIQTAQEHGFVVPQDYRAESVDDETLEAAAEALKALEDAEQMAVTIPKEKEGRSMSSIGHIANSLEEAIIMGEDVKTADGNKRGPSTSEIVDVLLSKYKGGVLYSLPHNQFFIYDTRRNVWSPFTKIETLGKIRHDLTMLGDFLKKGFTSNMMNDVFIQLQAALAFSEWYDGTDYLLFTNGILNVETRELLPFNREMYMTQQMPYEYDPSATCEPIVQWLKHTQQDSWKRTQVLRAWLRATLLGRYETQKFLEIVGPGKSGKSTYANLAVALVGKANCYSTDMENLEKNRFEAAYCFNKKLLLFQDADRWGGSVSKLKAITGCDWIRAERKYQGDAMDPFQYHGVVIITANEAIQSTDYTSGLARRRLTIPFDRPFEGGQSEQKELIKFDTKGNPQGVFAPLLPGLVNWVLDMSEDDMRALLMETSQHVPFFKKYEKAQSLRSNPMLDWLDSKVVFEPNESTPVGYCKVAASGGSGVYMNWGTWLYPSYAEFCRSCNVGIISRARFEVLLMDIIQHQLKLNAYSMKNTQGLRINNVAIRDSNNKYADYPSIVELAANPEEYIPFYGSVKIKAGDAKIDDMPAEM